MAPRCFEFRGARARRALAWASVVLLLGLVATSCGSAPSPPERSADGSAGRSAKDPHRLLRHATPEDFAAGSLRVAGERREFRSAVLAPGHEFTEVLPSWNVDVAVGASFCVDLRVAGAEGGWSPWLHLGESGEFAGRSLPCARQHEFEWGRVDVDLLRLERPAERVQYRVTAWSTGPSSDADAGADAGAYAGVGLKSFALCTSDARRSFLPPASPPPAPVARLAVPFRSQRWEAPELAPRICCPTSVAMVLAFRGVDVPTAEVARRAFDVEHDLYGNWSRAIQTAFELGVPGYLTRFSDWSEVRASLAAGQPLIVSIRAAPGELGGAPYPETSGHLVVLVGLDADGNPLVNDPAADSATGGRLRYLRSEFERAWMSRGGTAFVLLPR